MSDKDFGPRFSCPEVVAMSEATNAGPSETERRSNGFVGLVRKHLHDWLVLVGLLILDRVLASLHPFNRFVGEYMLDDIRYPRKENTVPFWAVIVICVLLPLLFIFSKYLKKKEPRDMHHAMLGLLFSVLLSATITDAIKDVVGRPRPDFFWRCFPDGLPVFRNVTREVLCHGDLQTIIEGHKSFPSGHAAWSSSGLGFFSLYLAGKIAIFDRRGHVSKLAIILAILSGAAYIGLSRVSDYKHHWQDVFAGTLLGLTMAALCYRQFFPAPHDDNCMHPYGFPEIRIANNPNSSAEIEHAVHQNSLPVNHTVTDVELGRIHHESS